MAVSCAYRADRKILDPCDVARDLPANARHRGWEKRFGCCAALSLGVLEVKRLLLLTLEMLIDSRPIRFTGALVPFVLSFVDTGLGFPVAIATVYAIRRHQAHPCYSKQGLRRIAFMLLICLILNVVTLILIGYRVNVRTETLTDIFRTSMKFYATKASYKLTLDELQLDLECCGSVAYADWFSFDWQGIDYDDNRQEYMERSVPFSCCKRCAMQPCAHMEMRKENVKTINIHGCAVILSELILKIVVVGYSLTGLIIFTQIVTIVLLIKIIQKTLLELCPSDCSCCEPAYPINEINTSSSSDDYARLPARYRRPRAKNSKNLRTPLKLQKFCRRPQTSRKVCRSASSRHSSPQPFVTNSWSSDSSCGSDAQLTSSPSYEAPRQYGSARIKPSIQLQHKLPEGCKQCP